MAMIKTMTSGEYLRLCQKHGVAPVYLDEEPKRRKREQAKPELNKTFGHGFVLVTPTKLPKPKKTKPLMASAEPFIKVRRKKPKRPAGKKKRWREHLQRVARAAERRAEHDRLAKGRWATGVPMSNHARIMRTVSGGLPSLGKRR
jgi:hypothetical protein